MSESTLYRSSPYQRMLWEQRQARLGRMRARAEKLRPPPLSKPGVVAARVEPSLVGITLQVEVEAISPSDPKHLRVGDIQDVVGAYYNVSRAMQLSQARTAPVVKTRQVGMYLTKMLMKKSLPEIGRRFGGKDHTTVLHAVRKCENLVATNPAIAEEIEQLRLQLQKEFILPEQ